VLAVAPLSSTSAAATSDVRASAPPLRAAGDQTRPIHVLLLTASTRSTAAIIAFEEAFRSTSRELIPGPVALHYEYTDLALFAGEPFERQLRDLLRLKYEHVPLDLVVVTHSRAVRFVVSNRAGLFPRAVVVFGGVDRAALGDVALGSDVTGVWLSVPWAQTLDVALRLQPDTSRVVVLGGTTPSDRTWIAGARTQLAPLAGRLRIDYPPDLPIGEIEKQVAALPDGAIVLVGAFLRDVEGRQFIGAEAVRRIAAASRVPVYVVNETFIGAGVVGGRVVSWGGLGARVAQLARRVLAGERPAPDEAGPSSHVFDARQLRRWQLDERRLPAGSVVRFRQPSTWSLYKWYVAAAGAVVLTQGLLISGLLISRAQRRQAQATLRERLRFETLLSDLVATFVAPLGPHEVERTVQHMLERVANALGVDRATLAETDPSLSGMRLTYSWVRTGIAPMPATVPREHFPWMAAQVEAGRVVHFERASHMPEAAATDRRNLAALGIRSLVAVPVLLDGKAAGALAFSTLRAERAWPGELLPRLQVVADVFAGVLARRRAESAALASEDRRLKAEEAAQRQREDLAHVLRVTTLSELAAALAHEISQPLAAILSNAQGTRRLLEHGRAAPAELTSALSDITDDARRGAQIVQRFRVMFGKRRVDPIPVDVGALAREVAALLRTSLGRRAILIRLEAAGAALPPVLGDPVQLGQVLVNLIMNAADAIDATQVGARVVRVETGRPATERIAIVVRDSGIGLKPTELERVFEPFVSSKPEGLGMGLAICRSIVQAHGGRIWATANEGAGLAVHVDLPCRADVETGGYGLSDARR
jgi:signal transduction histidine kinase